MKLQNYFQDPSSLHIGTEPLRAYYVPCREEAEANGADMLKASRAIILNSDDWKFKFYESYHQVPEGCTEKAADRASFERGQREKSDLNRRGAAGGKRDFLQALLF